MNFEERISEIEAKLWHLERHVDGHGTSFGHQEGLSDQVDTLRYEIESLRSKFEERIDRLERSIWPDS